MLITLDSGLKCSVVMSNKFHGHFATPVEYVISLICWSLGCVRLLNHIYLTALYHLKIPLLLIKIKRSK